MIMAYRGCSNGVAKDCFSQMSLMWLKIIGFDVVVENFLLIQGKSLGVKCTAKYIVITSEG